MGSGSKRKANDMVRINLPEAPSEKGGSGTLEPSRDINHICPPAFEVRLETQRRFPDDTTVLMKEEGLFVFGERVGRLPTKQSTLVARCATRGIHYSGKIINRGDKVYARFTQNT